VGVADVDALIARTVAFFADRAEAFEWKTHGHDQPGDLPARLREHGFVPEDVETVVIGEAARIAGDPVLPAGVTLREVSARGDLERIAVMESEVWNDDWSWLADDLAGRAAADSGTVIVLVAGGGGRAGERRVARLHSRYRVRRLVGRLDPARLAEPRHLPRTGGPPRTARRRAWCEVFAGGRLRRQPADPGTARVRRRDDHYAICVDAASLNSRKIIAQPPS
jgi:hypothetical protein